ncbi:MULTISPECIES: potassium channel family protein [Proteus]|uniref:potassium channel family protein n=1 Tax=Proteus TaxID=583 RepID=UPI00298C818E|nr:potassium channel family protein [Proteus mirabilis]
MKILRNSVVQYFLIILLFAKIYYSFWEDYPDSFIKNNALNSTPVQTAINLAFSHNNVVNEDYDNISSEDFSEEILQAKKEFDRLVSQKVNLERMLSEQESRLKLLDEDMYKAWGRNTLAYEKEMSLKHDKELVFKENELKAILSQKNKINEDQFNNILVDKNREIMDTKIRIATAKFKDSEYILSHVGDFHDPKLVYEHDMVNKIIDSIRSKLIINDKEMVKIRNNARDLLDKRQKEDLNFWDFLFYSIGISTTTTFGDLVANSKIIRGFVCMQLLLSILFLASVTQSFLSKKY